MKRFGTSISGKIFYPLLVVLYPITALLAHNIQEIAPSQSYQSYVVVLLVTFLALPVLRLIFKDWHKAALIYSTALLIFFTYGHIYSVLKTIKLGSFILGRHRHLAPTFVIFFLTVLSFVIAKKPGLDRFTRFANFFALGLLLIPILSILIYVLRSQTTWKDFYASPSKSLRSISVHPEHELPDIYYIILDGYARQDVMQEVYDYDNSEFLRSLESKGFYVADRSHTNHNYTALSLASSLNMEYAQNLGLYLVKGGYPGPFVKPIRNSLTREILEELGYQTVGFKSGYIPTELIDADYFFSPLEEDLDDLQSRFTLNAFEAMLLNTSAMRIVFDFVDPKFWTGVGIKPYYEHDVKRKIIQFSFEKGAEVPDIPGPTFTFMHFNIPHPPYIFGPNGEFINENQLLTLNDSSDLPFDDKSKLLYKDQATYTTHKVEELINMIIERSSNAPIIIIQADHGPSPIWERLEISNSQQTAILNAYLLPDRCDRFLYPSITPVNTFRVVFNCSFGGEFPLLDDKVFFSNLPRDHRYIFTDITDQVR